MSSVTYPHIEVRPDGRLYIEGTGFKVRMLVEEHLATGADAAQLREAHPHLTLGQIHSALAYYYDHKEELDREINDLHRFADEFRAQQGESTLAKKLREMGQDPA